MLHKVLSEYLSAVEIYVTRLENAHVERYEEERITHQRANLRIRIRFLNGYLIEINEGIVMVEGQLRHLGYRYHFQDDSNNLVFRYDDTPHFPELETSPHHKHIIGNVLPARKPSVQEIIEEANRLIK